MFGSHEDTAQGLHGETGSNWMHSRLSLLLPLFVSVYIDLFLFSQSHTLQLI